MSISTQLKKHYLSSCLLSKTLKIQNNSAVSLYGYEMWSIIFREEHNRVFRQVFGAKKGRTSEHLRIRYKELRDLH